MINTLLYTRPFSLTRISFPGILLVLMLTAACSNDPKDINSLVTKTAISQDRAEEVTLIYSERGKVKARLFTKEFIHNERATPPYYDMKGGLKFEFFNDSLTVESTLTAKYARYYDVQNNVLIRDSVVVVNKKGERLETEELVWNEKLKKFFTEKPVHITTAAQVMFGDGLEANQDFTWYEIKNLKGIVLVNKQEVP
jgi:LPS export ABC transporter protein LptC